MNPAIDLGIALAAISFLFAWLLVFAGADFGRPAHALTWAVAFCCFGGSWILALAYALVGPSLAVDLGLLTLPAMGTGLTCFAFHQRGGNWTAWRPIAIVIGVVFSVSILILFVTVQFEIAALPYSPLNAAGCWYASDALVGRRKGERAAERLTLYWLRGLSLIFLLLFVARILRILYGSGDEPLLRMIYLAPVLPAILTGLGLFAVLLLTADLADQSRRLAGTDMLTGLLNRRGFDEAALALFDSALRNDRALCLAVIDIDRFKEVNDRFGHLAGDEVLRRFADCLTQHAGPRDVLARIGGEEFALMLPDRDCDSARTLLDGARGMIETRPLDLPGDHRITASFGLASRSGAHDVAGLFSEADRALYLAKSSGRNRVVVSP